MSLTIASADNYREEDGVCARWSALRAAAARRAGARRLRREVASLSDALRDLREPADDAPQPHTRAMLHRRIEELKECLAHLLEYKVRMLKLRVCVQRVLGDLQGGPGEDCGLIADLNALAAAWEDAHHRTSSELASLENAVSAWAEWESALRELQGALKHDLAALDAIRARGDDQDTDVTQHFRQLAAALADNKSGSDSLSDSGISDGDGGGEGAGRARRLHALRELARRLHEALAPHSPAHRTITKRMEQTENDVRILQESCRALVELAAPDLRVDSERELSVAVPYCKTGAGDPDHNPKAGWLWRVLRSSLPIQICMVALLLAAWLVERPRCCDAINSLAQSLTPQLRYVRGPPPV